jgi:formamidopyrimidine-DNA glycosylase
MPELPDVEGFRRVLAGYARRRVRGVDVLDAGVLRGVGADRLDREVRGRTLGKPWRHGKWLGARVGGATLVFHFGMTGELYEADESAERHRHDRVVLSFAGGELRYRDQRKLQGLRLVSDVDRLLADTGPDALHVSRAEFVERLGGIRRQVKPALMDQSVLAGLGNLLADEVLWRARVHPRRPCADVDLAQLHGRMRTTLRQAVATGRVPPRTSWLTGRRDEPSGSCPRCGTTLSHGRVGGRHTVWCPRCQP